jgi:hypothetical protein
MANLNDLVTRIRYTLVEPSESFWTNTELLALLNEGIRDLWRRTKDLYQDYHYTVDSTNVSLPANSTTLTGVPADVAIVVGLEPRDLTAHRNLRFEPRRYMDAAMQSARASASNDPARGGTIYFAITGAGGPISAPVIYAAPLVTADVPLALTYIPTIPTIPGTSANPIPGESDRALINYVLAHTINKDKDNAQPDPTWMAAYEMEVTKIIVALSPRQEASEQVAEAFFEPYWS